MAFSYFIHHYFLCSMPYVNVSSLGLGHKVALELVSDVFQSIRCYIQYVGGEGGLGGLHSTGGSWEKTTVLRSLAFSYFIHHYFLCSMPYFQRKFTWSRTELHWNYSSLRRFSVFNVLYTVCSGGGGWRGSTYTLQVALEKRPSVYVNKHICINCILLFVQLSSNLKHLCSDLLA